MHNEVRGSEKIDVAYFAHIRCVNPCYFTEEFVVNAQRAYDELTECDAMFTSMNHQYFPETMGLAALFENRLPSFKALLAIDGMNSTIPVHIMPRHSICFGNTTHYGHNDISLFHGSHVGNFRSQIISTDSTRDWASRGLIPVKLLTQYGTLDVLFNRFMDSFESADSDLGRKTKLAVSLKLARIIHKHAIQNNRHNGMEGSDWAKLVEDFRRLIETYRDKLSEVDELEELLNFINKRSELVIHRNYVNRVVRT